MSFNTYEHWVNAIDKDGTLCISYGKDSLACLRAIELLGWNLKRIVHAEVWATDTISGDLPPMAEFKKKADKSSKTDGVLRLSISGQITPMKTTFTK